ncbi:MAG TPA: hypothetical protein VFK05_33180, partial [Polyangiaceae bacterium]|nr:hypothetical protein [Polyangiaceae bacterium]
EPAEAKPGTAVTWTALVAVPPTLSAPAGPRWSLCTAPKPLTENNIVSSRCLGSASLIPLGEGPSLTAATTSNACTLFGPDASASGSRPRDPDPTGGYFQPLRLDLAGAVATFHLQRVSCNLSDASAELAREFGLKYLPNGNPQLAPLVASVAGQPVGLDAIHSGARVELEVGWSAEDAEQYAYFDRVAQAISTRREAMSVSWYVSAGELDTETTGRSEEDPTLTSDNAWLAPTLPELVILWIVLRDSRGGVDFAQYPITVQP